MSIFNAPKILHSSECLDKVRIILNNNFNVIQDNIKIVEDESVNTANRLNVIRADIFNKINKLNDILIEYVCNIKMYLSTDITNFSGSGNKLYILPYNGSGVYLFSDTYNRWIYRTIKNNQILTFNLNELESNTSYDIFLGFNEDTKEFQIKFVKWDDKDQTFKKRDSDTSIVLVDNVKVNKDFKSFRYMGCLRTTLNNTVESTNYGNDLAGAHLKQYLWNYYNREKKTICNKITGFYENLYTYTSSNNLNSSWFRTSYINEKDNLTSGSCFSFILGDYTYIDLRYVNYINSVTNSVTVYSGVTINNQFDFNNEFGSLLVGIKTINGTDSVGNTTSTYTAVLPPGNYTLQTHDACTNKAVFNKNYDTTLKTGFIASIVN